MVEGSLGRSHDVCKGSRFNVGAYLVVHQILRGERLMMKKNQKVEGKYRLSGTDRTVMKLGRRRWLPSRDLFRAQASDFIVLRFQASGFKGVGFTGVPRP